MIDQVLRDFQVLRKAEFLIGEIWLNVLLRRLGLLAFAGLIAVFGLAMANLAAYHALGVSLGTVWAAAVLAAVDIAIAAIVLLAASNARPGTEIEVALEVRKMAVESLQADARDLRLTLEALGQEMRSVRAGIAQFVQDPLEVAAQKLIVPAAFSIVRGLRSKKEHA